MSDTMSELIPAHSRQGKTLIPGSDFIAGIFGGVLAGHPFDTVKVRLQAQNSKYKGTLDCLAKTIREERFRGLFKGMGSPLVGVALINSLLFGVYGWALENVSPKGQDLPPISSIFMAGSISGFVNAFLSTPMELVKIRLQNQGTGAPLYKGPIDCINIILKTQGFRGLYRGFWMTLLRETPSYGVYFASYEIMTRALQQDSSSSEPTFAMLIAGGAAGVCGWASTYPADVAKTRIQSASNQTNPNYKGIVQSFKTIYRLGGTSVFFSGLGATIVRAFPTNACTFYTVIWVKNYLEKHL